MKKIETQKGFTTIIFILSVIVVSAVILVSSIYFRNNYLQKKTVAPTQTRMPIPKSTPIEITTSSTNTNKPEFENVKTVNFNLCKKEEGYRQDVGFGSTGLTIKNDLEDICEVEIFKEIEGGYSSYNCLIPKSLGKINIKINMAGSDFSQIQPYCTKKKSGNILMELNK